MVRSNTMGGERIEALGEARMRVAEFLNTTLALDLPRRAEVVVGGRWEACLGIGDVLLVAVVEVTRPETEVRVVEFLLYR